MKADNILTEERVFTRSHPTGRGKIQDKWNSKVYKVVNGRDMSMKLNLLMVKDPPELSVILNCKSAPNPSHGFHQEFANAPKD